MTTIDPLKSPGVDPLKLRLHQSRIVACLKNKTPPTIPIVGACTTNNGGILSWRSLVKFLQHSLVEDGLVRKSALEHWRINHCVTFLPAAGAASRYLFDCLSLCQQCETNNPSFVHLFESFKKQCMPPKIPLIDISNFKLFAQQFPVTLENFDFPASVTHTFVNGNLVYGNGVWDESEKGQRLLFNR